jgi:two-component system chemotaxis sensor kinase CheA
MDVVKRNITALRGTVSVRSTEGVGTTFTVRLPLTLAIINGFQVGLGSSIYVLPLESIEECIEYSAVPGHDFTSLRGETLPFIRLRDIFQTRAPAVRRQSIVVVRHAGQRAGIVVDSLIGESQTVIKPLGRLFRQADCVSGSSILGTGDVALILDVPLLVQRAVERARQESLEAVPPAGAIHEVQVRSAHGA